MIRIKIDWYKAFDGDKYNLPGSQGQGIYIVQSILVPLQAAIALISGKSEGDLEALRFYASNEDITCETCDRILTKSGNGHDKDECQLYRQAVEVLTSNANEGERRLLLAEQKRLTAKLDQAMKKLSVIAK